MPDRHTEAAAVPVPDAGDDIARTSACACGNPAEHGPHEDGPTTGDYTLRERLAKAYRAAGSPRTPWTVADALLPLIRDHVAAAVQAERERRHDPRCLRLTDSENNIYCDCRTLAMIDGGEVVTQRAEKAEAAIERVRDVCDAVAYKMPSDPESYGPYPEGRCDLAGEVLAALDGEATDG